MNHIVIGPHRLRRLLRLNERAGYDHVMTSQQPCAPLENLIIPPHLEQKRRCPVLQTVRVLVALVNHSLPPPLFKTLFNKLLQFECGGRQGSVIVAARPQAKLSSERTVAQLNWSPKRPFVSPVSCIKKISCKAMVAQPSRLLIGQAHRSFGRCLGHGKVLEVQGSVSDGLQIEIWLTPPLD